MGAEPALSGSSFSRIETHMSEVSAFIDDGYTETKFIAERKGIHPSVTFTFRPTPIEERARIVSEAQAAKDPAQAERIIAVRLKEHLVNWTLTKEINAANILRMKSVLLSRMVTIVLYGSDGGDKNPEEPTTDETLAHDETEVFSAINNVRVADVIAANDSKN